VEEHRGECPGGGDAIHPTKRESASAHSFSDFGRRGRHPPQHRHAFPVPLATPGARGAHGGDGPGEGRAQEEASELPGAPHGRQRADLQEGRRRGGSKGGSSHCSLVAGSYRFLGGSEI